MAYDFSNVSVLIVDDNRFMTELIKSLLQTFGIRRIFTANDPDKGFRIFCEERPDLIISDWVMEGGTGLDLSRKVREDSISPNPYAPIILVTGYAEEKRVIEARDKGITEFLVKPFKANDLYTRIEQIIEKPRRFVKCIDYFGPDRRRKKKDEFSGPFRRDDDHDVFEIDINTD